MKVVSLIQPWATLIALGEKSIETRSWATKYRGEIAIHASQTIDKTRFEQPTFKRLLKKHGITDISQIPTGVIVAVANLVDIKTTEELKKSISRQEKILGIYKKGRVGWMLDDIKATTPIPVRGKLGVWEYETDITAEIISA
jgi:ASCH domain.